MPGTSFARLSSVSWKVANCCSPAIETSPATTPFSSSLSVSATRLSLAAAAAPVPLAIMLGTLFSTASSLVSASCAALKPPMASAAQDLIFATEITPPSVRKAAPTLPATPQTLLNLLLAFFAQPLMTLVAALICFCCFLTSAVVFFRGLVNWSFSASRILTFLVAAIPRLHFHFHGGLVERTLRCRQRQQLLQRVPPADVVGEQPEVTVAPDQFFNWSRMLSPMP